MWFCAYKICILGFGEKKKKSQIRVNGTKTVWSHRTV